MPTPPRPSRNTCAEGCYLWLWFWRLERRRGQNLPGTLLFIALIGLLIGLLRRRDLVPTTALPAIFWMSYLFTLFQAIPKSFLDISSENWRWLRIMVSPMGAAWGILLYVGSWGIGLWAVWYAVSVLLWGYEPTGIGLVTAGGLALVVGLSAFLAAIARLSYATANILALPLVLMPLLLILFRSHALLENLFYLGLGIILVWALLPLLWEG